MIQLLPASDAKKKPPDHPSDPNKAVFRCQTQKSLFLGKENAAHVSPPSHPLVLVCTWVCRMMHSQTGLPTFIRVHFHRENLSPCLPDFTSKRCNISDETWKKNQNPADRLHVVTWITTSTSANCAIQCSHTSYIYWDERHFSDRDFVLQLVVFPLL
jgi:hypothetical protein